MLFGHLTHFICFFFQWAESEAVNMLVIITQGAIGRNVLKLRSFTQTTMGCVCMCFRETPCSLILLLSAALAVCDEADFCDTVNGYWKASAWLLLDCGCELEDRRDPRRH